MSALTQMPPLQHAAINGLRMGYYDAGPKDDPLPMVLCHGWPELAFSWRHQIKALSEAGIRVIAPDQRGYGATDRPETVEAYDIEHLTADLVALLDHLGIDKAIFVGHDWGGFVVWQMPLRHQARVAGVVGINTPHTPRAPADPIDLLRHRYGEQMYIIQFQQDGRQPDAIFGGRVRATFEAFMRKPLPRPPAAETPTAGVGASPKTNLAFPQMVAAYDATKDPRQPILSPEELQVFVDTFTRTGFTGGINWYRNMSRNWRRSADLDHTVRVPALMIMAEHDAVLPPLGLRWHGGDRARSREASGARQRPLDPAGAAGGGQRHADCVASPPLRLMGRRWSGRRACCGRKPQRDCRRRGRRSIDGPERAGERASR